MNDNQFRLFGGTIHSALVHAATAYDRRQAKGTRYNPYALGQYLQRIADVEADIARGAKPRAALIAAFSGRFLDAMLKAVGEPPHTREEKRGDWTYQPVTEPSE